MSDIFYPNNPPSTPDSHSTPRSIPPHFIEAEQSVLGGLMLDNRAWLEVAKILNARDFYRADHRLVFSAIQHLTQKGLPCDIVTLGEYLESLGKIENAGGLAYLGVLVRTPRARPT